MSTNPSGLSRFTRLALPFVLATAGCVAGMDATETPTGSGGSGVGAGTGGSGPTGSGGSGNGSGGSTGSGGSGGAIAGSGGSVGSGGVGTGSGGAPADPNQCLPMAAVPRRLWRLSNLQYSNSIRDLLKLTGTLPEITGGGTAIGAFFSKDTEQVDDRLAFDYYTASEAAVAQIDPIRLAACTTGEAEQACAQRFITALATAGFRRPVGAAEVADLMVLYTEGRKKDFASGIRLMVQGVLLAPTFAYRTELGTGTAMPATITPYEVASQLSYLFLNSIPDAALMTAASNGSLGTPAGVMTQVDRLLASTQGQANISRMVVDWFGGRQTKGKEARFNFTEAMQADVITATRLFVEDVLWKGTKRVEDLLLSNRMFVNPALAPLYGFTVPAGTPATTFVAVSAPAGQRAGILTQPGIAVAKSNTDETSVVHRGLFILKDILCGITVPDPPAGLLESEAVVKALASFTTERQRTDYRLKTASCATCHINIDPYGMMLEHIDPIGRYRTTLPDGGPVAATWNLNLSPSLTGNVTGAVQFAEGLVKDKMFTMCATRKMASYALGIDQPKACELVTIHDKFQASADHSIATLLREVSMASFMRTRGAQ